VTNGPFATIPTFADATKQGRLTERGSTKCRKLYFTLHYRFRYRRFAAVGTPGVPLQQADKLLCESWNERMWSDGDPIDPSPTIDQAVNGGFPWLEIRCSRCKTPSDVDLAGMEHPPTTFVHDLAGRLRCRKCAKAGRCPVDPATIVLAAAPSPPGRLIHVLVWTASHPHGSMALSAS
jgi:phage FluMu protein Com